LQAECASTGEHPFDKIDPGRNNSETYGEQFEIYLDGFCALRDSGVYEKLAAFQKKHWG
jgi:hypothetical protein